MSRTKTPILLDSNRKDVGRVATWLETLRLIQETIAPHVIAHSVMEGDDHVEAVVTLMGKSHLLENIQAEDARLSALGHETCIATPTAGDPAYTEHLDDAALTLGVAWGSAGYLVGLAVGMQLGSHAFDRIPKGGAR